jgi:alpha-beta hydrolase superfamily lysophospholipase
VGEADGSAPERVPAWPRRHWLPLVALAAAIVLALGIGAAVSWHFSSQVLVPDHSEWPEDVTVEALRPGRVVLSETEESARPGVYGLDWQAGHAVIGEVLRSGDESVTRTLQDVSGYLVPGMKVAIDSKVYRGDPMQALGMPFDDVRVPGELGRMPAWQVGAPASTWAIVVHGINDNLQCGLRLLPELRREGLAALLITYREDLGAPPSPDGLHHMGLTEWRDLASAARYAVSHGARRLVLIGYSMGGSLVTQFMQHSRLASRVAGLVLDAPALDWQEVLSFQASEMGLPGVAAKPVEWAISARIDADWEDLDALDHPEALRLPILLFHGTDDEVVPISTSEDLAAELPGRVTYHHAPQAGHTEAWNVNPGLYERRLRDFLRAIGAAGPRSRATASSSPRSPRA